MATTSVRSTILPDGTKQIERLHAPGLGSTRAGRESQGIEHVDVDREIDVLGAVERFGDGVLDDRRHAPVAEFAHQMPAHPLRTHPFEDVLRRPVSAQSDLDEVAPGHDAGTR